MIEPSTSPQSGNVVPGYKQSYSARKMYYAEDPNAIGQKIIQLVCAYPDPQTMLSEIARLLGEIFCADACLLAANPSRGDKAQMGLYRAGQSVVLPKEAKAQLLGHPLFADVVAGAEPLAIADLQGTDRWPETRFCWEALPVRALLRIPTRDRGLANGMIAIGHFQPHCWSSAEKDLLKAIANSVTLALSHAQLQQQVQIGHRYQALLNKLSGALHSTSKLSEILSLALAETSQALEVERGWIVTLKYNDPLHTHRRRKSVPQATVAVKEEWLAHSDARALSVERSFPLADCPFCTQAWQQAPQALEIAQAESASSKKASPFSGERANALLLAPLMGRTSSESNPAIVLGFLVFQDSSSRSWQADELELADWVSAQVSTAMLHNQALLQVQSLVDERTAQLKLSLDVQAKLSEKMRQQIEELQQLNQLKDEFLDAIQHELKTPLATMKMAIRMLRQPELTEERRTRYLDILEQEWSREDHLIQDLLTLQKLESNQFLIQPQQFDLKTFIDNLTQSFEQKWESKGLTLKVDYSTSNAARKSSDLALIVDTDPGSLQRILEELLANAGKYSDPETTVKIAATRQTSREGDRIILSVTNTGPGIEAEEIEAIFEKFHRGQGMTAQAVQGTGLGLALVKSLVQHLDGTIEVTSCAAARSRPGETCFTITLPQLQP